MHGCSMRPKQTLALAILLITVAATLSGCFGVIEDLPYRIAGTIRDENNNPLQGVRVYFDNQDYVHTNSSGHYEKSGLEGTVEVRPVQGDYEFHPERRFVTGPSLNVNFTRRDDDDPSYRIAGTIRDEDGNRLQGVRVYFDNQNYTTTNSSGYYERSGLEGTVEVRPVQGDYEFHPEKRFVTGPSLSVDFTRLDEEELTGSVAGYILIEERAVPASAAAPLAGPEALLFTSDISAQSDYIGLENAEVTIAGRSDTTDRHGYYRIDGISPGRKTVTVDHEYLRETLYFEAVVEAGKLTQVRDQYAGIGYYIYIGIDKYEEFDSLSGAVEDAKRMKHAMQSGTLAGMDKLLVDEEATKAEIKAAIEEACDLAYPEDYLVLYFSGRVISDADIDNIVPYDGRDYSQYPDRTLISDGELEQWLRAFPGEDVTVILDASFSGSFVDGTTTWAQTVEPLALKKSGYTVLAAARSGEGATYDPNLGDDGASVFTYFLAEGLRDGGHNRRADANRDGRVTAQEAFNYTKDAMEAYFDQYPGFEHRPVLWNPGSTTIFRYR